MTSVRNNAVSAALLLGWVIFGCLNSSVLADVAQKSGEKSQNQDSVDVDYYDESSPENMKAPVKPAPTLMPYFEEEKKTVYAKEDAEVILNCPVKNYNESQHMIMWFKNNNTITTGREILVDAALGYHLDKDMNLVIDKVSEKTKGEYYCTIMPQNVRLNIVLEIGEQPAADNKQAMVSASALSLVLALLAHKLSFGIVSLHNIF
ncbi:uncharacterized protein LOC128866482 [Anastrepha ludens]|uniref:uncharacterized protein LOC128866482 n=1 Tax=Anastrepha ludens TaxID=28586 RepID=UPI0023B1D275|nr:uncharacterized protein LOC128866482 [Anastrepha ludens]